MKKILCAFLPCLLTVSLFGCSNTPTEQTSSNLETQNTSATSSTTEIVETNSEVSSNTTTTSSSSNETTSTVSQTTTTNKPTSSTAKPEPPEEEKPQYETMTMDYTGYDAEYAIELLETEGFSVTLEYEYNNRMEQNHVISQSIQVGDIITEHKITLYVSKGTYIELPEVP